MTSVNAFNIDHWARLDWIDIVLADSFPASDPPSWTSGIAMPTPSLPDTGGAERNATAMLQPGDLLPHFDVTDLGGKRIEYSSIWQRRNLVLVTMSEADSSSGTYAERLIARAREFNEDHTEWVVTRDRIAGLPNPGAIVADRWGEVMHVVHPSDVASLPAPDDLVEWVNFVQHRCPECEGEVK
jgi:hypothetical protein